ncbi:hypothetical protein GE061_005133 [Apolygus lucorum]|uniref:Uncharacterized protein n=1 Tax=Apolygus lucorum TaxID=248454 RepID=A0A8S9WWU4_APOLU|nr:hypothetical protein GE061_005133 [Apolygus lucorum]
MSVCKVRAKQFFDESSIHGLRYITERDRHWTERLFWIVTCSLASLILVKLSNQTITQVVNSPVSFVQETSYLKWNTEFPSVSVCETDADLGNIEVTAEKNSTIRLFSNTSTGPGVLSFFVHREVFVFLHAKEDVPYFNIPEEFKELVMLSSDLVILFKVNEIENDPLLLEVPVKTRKCRFPHENSLKHHKAYSYSACVTECRLKAQMNDCNCTHHFMKTSGMVSVCRLEQFECLLNYSDTWKRLKPHHSPQVGIHCPCESSCTEHDLVVVSKHIRALSDDAKSRVVVKMQNLPSERFKRYLIKGKGDVFVTIGGLLGLFLGASILSVAEIIYFLCFRKTSLQKRGVVKAEAVG